MDAYLRKRIEVRREDATRACVDQHTTTSGGPGVQPEVAEDMAFIQRLIDDLSDGDWITSAGAQEKLARLGARAVDAVCEIVQSGSESARWRAAWVLGRLGDVTSVPVLCAAMVEPGRGRVSAGPSGVTRVFIPTDEQMALLQLECVEALGRIGCPSAAPALVTMLRNPSLSLRSKAVRALALLGAPGLRAAEAALDSAHAEELTTFLEAMVPSGDETSFRFAVSCLEDPRGQVRAQAAEAIHLLAARVPTAVCRTAHAPLDRLVSGWSMETQEFRNSYKSALETVNHLTHATRDLPAPARHRVTADPGRLPIPSGRQADRADDRRAGFLQRFLANWKEEPIE